MPAHRLAERGLAHALTREPLEVDIGENKMRGVQEALGLGEQFAVFVDHRLPVPRQVGRRLAPSRRCVQIRRKAPGGLLPNQLMPVTRLADHHVRCRQIHQHRRARERGERRRRHRHPDVLADFHVKAEQRHVGNFKQQRRSERHFGAQQRDAIRRRVLGRAELARFVELAVVRQITLRHDALDLTARDHHGAVEKRMVDAQRHAHDHCNGKVLRCRHDRRERLFAGIEQRPLVEQVVAGVSRKPKLRERDQHRTVCRRLLRQVDGFGGVERRIGNAATGHAYRHASEIVAVEIEESVFHLELVHTMPRIRGSCSGA